MAKTVKELASKALIGAHSILDKAEARLKEEIKERGADNKIAFPDTDYYLPVIYGLTGTKVKKLKDLESVLSQARELLPEVPGKSSSLPYLGPALDAGIVTLLGQECLEALKYVLDPGWDKSFWLGAASDELVKQQEKELAENKISGFVITIGEAPTNETAAKLANSLKENGFYVFMAGSNKRKSLAEQLTEAGFELSWDSRLVPAGPETSAVIYPFGLITRIILSLGQVKAGEYKKLLNYSQKQIFAYIIALGELDEELYATAAGGINYGFLTMAKEYIPQLLPVYANIYAAR